MTKKKEKPDQDVKMLVEVQYSGENYPVPIDNLKKGLPKPPPSEAESFQPTDNRVLVLQDEEQNVTKGGIFIPEGAKEKPMKGTVIKAGPGTYSTAGTLIPSSVKAGDRVLFGKYGGTEVLLDTTTYLIMRDSDIYGIL